METDKLPFEDLLVKLSLKENEEGALFPSKIKSNLQSYDILENERFKSLEDLKDILDA